jgi:hypothetical protein
MLWGCLVVALLAMISLSAKPLPDPAARAPAAAAAPQVLELTRIHSLTGVSARAVSKF